MDPQTILWRGGAIVLAAVAGWLFGRRTPGWQIDQANENTDNLRYYYGSMYEGYGCTYAFGSFFRGAWGAGALVLAAMVCGAIGWQQQLFGDPGVAEHSGGLEILFNSAFWLLMGAAAAGYIASRLTDKGPVGPLE